MFRASRALTRLNGPQRANLIRQFPLSAQQTIAPLPFLQRASFATKKKDDRADPPPPKQPIDYEREREIGERKIEARPDQVSSKSSTTNSIRTPIENTAGDPIMQEELKHDMGIIKDTFNLDNVPKESKVLGLMGTIPYFATSLSTVYLGWNLKQELPTGNSFFDMIAIDHNTASYLLSVVEPVQLGYGAVIISFLGAIHWGLEYAEKAPSHNRTRFRYGLGLIAPVVAWPTLIMPVPYALTTQFMAFVGLYFADATATTRGWAPHWYGSYRFALTALVGLALFVSLVGRQKIGQGDALTHDGLQKRLEQKGLEDTETNWDELEKKEREKLRKEKAEAEKKAKEEEEKKKKEEKKNGKKSKAKSSSKDDGGDGEKADDKAEKKDNKKEDKKEDDSEGKQDDGDNESDGDDDENDKAEKKDGDKKDDKKNDKKDDEESKDEEKSDDKEGEDKDSEDKSEGGDDKESDDNKDDKKDDEDSKKDDEEDKKDDKEEKSDDEKDDKKEKKDKKN